MDYRMKVEEKYRNTSLYSKYNFQKVPKHMNNKKRKDKTEACKERDKVAQIN